MTRRNGLWLAAAALCFAMAGWIAQRLATGTGPAGAEPAAGMSPLIRFAAVGLGPFRGLAGDLLWVRAARLQDDGRYMELVELSGWIAALQPHDAGVWTYQAWNLAYNISVMFPDPSDRWRWIESGLRLLRDQGLPAAAGEPRMYSELAWLYTDRVGGQPNDPYAAAYRKIWAERVEASAPGGRVASAAACQPLGLDLNRVRILETQTGILDWRTPEAHALYWAWQGLRISGTQRNPMCGRMVLHSLYNLAHQGRLKRNATTGEFLASPLPDVWPALIRECADALAAMASDDPTRSWVGRVLTEGHRVLNDAGRIAAAAEAQGLLKRYFTDGTVQSTQGSQNGAP
ncbi:MAG: hypothetical protein WCL16_09260 [bacterium]